VNTVGFVPFQVRQTLAVSFHSKWDEDLQFHSILHAAKTGIFVTFRVPKRRVVLFHYKWGKDWRLHYLV
jgi:hypothetical protein